MSLVAFIVDFLLADTLITLGVLEEFPLQLYLSRNPEDYT
jgi:hypothetical protein